MVKHSETGWTCQKCGYAPFAGQGGGPSPDAAPPPSASPPVPPPPRPAADAAPPPRRPPAVPAVRTVFQYAERQPHYDRQMWVEAGKGLRFSRLVPLSVLPPGEPIKMEIMVHNSGNGPLATTYYLSLTNPNLQSMRLVGESPDLAPNEAFDVTQTITTALLPGDYSLTMFCLPHPPSPPQGRPVDSSRTGNPPLRVMDGSIPQGLAGLYNVLKVRTSLVCPTCRGVLLWSYEGAGGRPRAWACGRCGYRLESGML